MTAALDALAARFDRLADAGRVVDLWWRDDDAVEATPALDRLLGLAEAARWPVCLAVIPALARPSLPERLAGRDDVTVLVHGWTHANHAPPHEKTAEFGAHRAVAEMDREMRDGRDRLASAFGERALPVFVPPWNRIAPAAAAALPRLGYRALSCFGGAEHGGPLARLDAHLDPVDWRGGRSLARPDALTAQLDRAIDRGVTRIGFLTHHLMFDDVLWSFVEGVAALAADHPATRPIGLSQPLIDRLAGGAADASLLGAAA
ncbi:polysaccharide deacetylase family protein [Enterovirga rhinocerotis]|uniref:Polysaccharide deacetylase n=1 Tax=Enterovirga rhinocerotis TaxID=1339210 RepID=A0A4R7C5Y5_9HYPH|nr:polysaccharide deacetylase family protein [Enterovirga rhinocerotis]TDR93974.1 polysaccharide deacetylase [Enterovirga rhinocerotis]